MRRFGHCLSAPLSASRALFSICVPLLHSNAHAAAGGSAVDAVGPSPTPRSDPQSAGRPADASDRALKRITGSAQATARNTSALHAVVGASRDSVPPHHHHSRQGPAPYAAGPDPRHDSQSHRCGSDKANNNNSNRSNARRSHHSKSALPFSRKHQTTSRVMETADLHVDAEPISPLEIDASVVPAAQAFIRRHLCPPSWRVEEVFGTVKHTMLKTISIHFRVTGGDGEGRTVTAVGISRRKKTAVTLCYMHAARLIQYYTETLPKWQEQAKLRERQDDAGAAATSSPPPPPPKPLREATLHGEARDRVSAEGAASETRAEKPSQLPSSSTRRGSMTRPRSVPPLRPPPQPQDFRNWEEYARAAASFVADRRLHAREAALLQLRLPKTGNELVDCAAAIVERHVPPVLTEAEGRPKSLTRQERNAKLALEAMIRRASRQMQTARLKPDVSLATLVLDASAGTVAMGVARREPTAKARCAMHALCILNLTRLDNASLAEAEVEEKSGSNRQTDHRAANGALDQRKLDMTGRFFQRVLRSGKVDGASSATEEDYFDGCEGSHAAPARIAGTPHAGSVSHPTLPSAPLKQILASLTPHAAKQYAFFTSLFVKDGVRPAVRFARDPTTRVYTCQLTLSDLTAEGTGINRFEAERAALETVLAQLDMFDTRMQAVQEFVRACPHVSPENVPTADLPPYLCASLTDRLRGIREKLSIDQADTLSAPARAFADENDGAAAGNDSDDKPESSCAASAGEANEEALSARPSGYSLAMQARLAALRTHPRYLVDFHPRRSTLAMASVEEKLVQTVADSRVTIVCGTTGCGKTTQVPQYLLDHEIACGRGERCHILVTQPRRLTAFSVAERIAQERLERVGEDVGYVVRLDAKPGKHLTLCTSGVLVQMLSSNPNLEGITHLILDEVHERDINCDVILSLGKQVLGRNPNIKMILMSATMQVGLFAQYFNNPPTISVEGAVYPVREVYLEDVASFAEADGDGAAPAFYSPMFDTIDAHASHAIRKARGAAGGWRSRSSPLTPPQVDYQLIAYLVHRSIAVDMQGNTQGKSVLVFLPGWKEILAAKQAIQHFTSRGKPFNNGHSPHFHFILLHSTVDSALQRQCFQPAPTGLVKVVLATNIAESGITIDDAAVVIDTGLIKLTSWVASSGRPQQPEALAGGAGTPRTTNHPMEDDVEGASAPTREHNESQAATFSTQLALCYASRANGTQRKGRAGRTQGGVCYRLFTRATWDALPVHQPAEIHRVPLTQVLLRLLSLGHTAPKRTLRTFIEPPGQQNVEASMVQLKSLDAVTADEALTPLGHYLAKLPCDPRVGKMIMLGAVLHCMDSILTVAATADACPFVLSRDVAAETRKRRYLFARGSQSDHVSYLNAFNAFCFNREDGQFARFNYLNVGSLFTISKYKLQYRDILCASGLINADELADGTIQEPSPRPTHAMAQSSSCASGVPSSALKQGQPSCLTGEPSRQRCRHYEGEMFVDTSRLSADAGDVALVKACICAALFPNVAVLDSTEVAESLTAAAGGSDMGNFMKKQKGLAKKVKLRTKGVDEISPAAESACRRIGAPTRGGQPGPGSSGGRLQSASELMQQLTTVTASAAARATDDTSAVRFPAMYYVYQDIFSLREARKRFLTGVTSVSLWALLLFGASDAHTQYFDRVGVCVVDGWLPVRINSESFTALTELKRTLHACVWRKYKEPRNSDNNGALDVLRKLCKDVLKAPLDQQDLTLNRLVDSGEIIHPVYPFSVSSTTSISPAAMPSLGVSVEVHGKRGSNDEDGAEAGEDGNDDDEDEDEDEDEDLLF